MQIFSYFFSIFFRKKCIFFVFIRRIHYFAKSELAKRPIFGAFHFAFLFHHLAGRLNLIYIRARDIVALNTCSVAGCPGLGAVARRRPQYMQRRRLSWAGSRRRPEHISHPQGTPDAGGAAQRGGGVFFARRERSFWSRFLKSNTYHGQKGSGF